MIKNGKEVYRNDCSCSYCEHHRAKKKPVKKTVKKASVRSMMRQEARVKMENISDCEDCGAPKQCVHHIIPLSEGGTNDRHNLKALCTSCHRQYHKELPDFLFS